MFAETTNRVITKQYNVQHQEQIKERHGDKHYLRRISSKKHKIRKIRLSSKKCEVQKGTCTGSAYRTVFTRLDKNSPYKEHYCCDNCAIIIGANSDKTIYTEPFHKFY